MTYPYSTLHFEWRIFDLTDFGGAVYMDRFIPDPSDRSHFGGRYVEHSDYGSSAEAERAADEWEWERYPLERDELEPIPLVGRAA